MTKQLNKEQLHTLEKYERYFAQAVGARYCSYPGQAGVAEMLGIWNEVTGEGRKIRQGCSTCIFHLVVDLGTIYLAQKAEADKAAAAKKAEEDRKKKEAEEKAEAERQKAALEEAAKKAAADATATVERVSGLAEGLEPGGPEGQEGPEGNEPSGTSEKPNTQSAEKPADEKAAQEGPAPSDGTTTQQKPKGRSRAKGEGKEGQK